MTIKFCSLNAWGSRSNTENTHDAIASLEKLSHRCVFFWCGACGAVYAAAGEQDNKADGGDHIHACGFASSRINFFWAHSDSLRTAREMTFQHHRGHAPRTNEPVHDIA